MRILFLAILITIASLGKAQNGFVIKDVTVFDGENIIKNTSVKIQDHRIVEIAKNVEISDGFEVVNGEGKFLMPALSNAHVHAWSPKFLKDAAQAGILNVMDMHGLENFQQFMLNVKDSTNFARFYRAGYAATAPNGHGTQFGFPVPTLEKPEDAKTFVDERKQANVDYIKIIVEPSRTTLTHPTIANVITHAHDQNLKTVVHVSHLKDGIQVIQNDADGLVHIWRDESISESDLTQLANEKEFFVIPTLLTTFKAIDYLGEKATGLLTKDQLLVEIKRLYEAGIPILTGTDPPNFEINFGTDLHEELLLYEQAGIPNQDILKTATINVAKAFDLNSYGMIKKGYTADLILINGDPVENMSDIKNIEMVWKEGKLVNRD